MLVHGFFWWTWRKERWFWALFISFRYTFTPRLTLSFFVLLLICSSWGFKSPLHINILFWFIFLYFRLKAFRFWISTGFKLTELQINSYSLLVLRTTLDESENAIVWGRPYVQTVAQTYFKFGFILVQNVFKHTGLARSWQDLIVLFFQDIWFSECSSSDHWRMFQWNVNDSNISSFLFLFSRVLTEKLTIELQTTA